jgi:hypothetical protein
MTDRPALRRRRDRETRSASAILRLESVPESGRWRLALAALAVTAATVLLPIALRAQDSASPERPAPKGRVVVEHSAGDLELPPPAASPVRAGRFVRLSGSISDTLDGTSVGGARVELLGTRVSARSTDDGRFQLAPVAPGRYAVRVTRIGYQPVTIEDVKFPEDVEGAPLSVVMRRGSVGVSAMNARATMQGGFAGGKGGWLVSARPGYLDVALKFTEIADSIQPRYYDLFAKAQYDLPRGGRIAMHVLRAGDSFRFLKKDEPNIFSSYGSSYGWLTWDNAMIGGRLRMQTVASAGALAWQRHGENYATTGAQTAEIDDSRSLDRVGFRQDWTLDVTPRLMFKWGADAKRETAAYDYYRLLGTRQADGTRAGRNDSVSTQVAPRADKLALYFAPRVQVFSSLTVEAGARLDRSTLTDESIVSPRLNVSWQPRERTVVRAAWGGYSQSQPLFSLQAEDGVTSFAPAERAEQRTIGVEHSMRNGIVARVETYEKRLTHARGRYANLGGDLWLFPELLWDRKLIDRTAGLDRGVELQLARSDAERMDWSLGYALSKSTDVVEGRTVPRAFDQRHAIHGDWSLHPRNDSWRLSVGGLWHSGWPYTPTNLSVDTVTNTPTKFAISTWRTPGELNSARLRSYHRVDVRWTKYFHTRSGRLAVFGEVYNLFGTVNPRGYWRDATVDGRKVTLTTGEINQWPRLPVAGFSWQF